MKKVTSLSFVFLFLLVTLIAASGSANNSNEYVLYRKDTKFSLEEYPAEMIDGQLYVPSSFFIGLDNIKYEYMPSEKSFYFINTKTGKYFSFSFAISNIIVNGEFTQIKFPAVNSTIYMPLEYCAQVLSLKTETYTEGKVVRVRLNDGSEKLSFIELIELFDPAGRLETTNPDDPNRPSVLPPEIDPPTPVVTEKKNVYLMLKADDVSGLEEMLDALRAFGERATVFFDKEVIEQLPEEVLHAAVNSNAIAISTDSESALPITEQIQSTNNSIALLSNISSLIYTCDTVQGETDEVKNSRYVLWQPTHKREDYPEQTAQKMYEDILNEERAAVMISTSKDNLNFLMSLLGYLSNDENITLATINYSTKEIKTN